MSPAGIEPAGRYCDPGKGGPPQARTTHTARPTAAERPILRATRVYPRSHKTHEITRNGRPLLQHADGDRHALDCKPPLFDASIARVS